MGAGWKLALTVIFTSLAAGARSPALLLALVVIILGYYAAAGLTLADLWNDVKFFLFQAALVIPLYCLIHGPARGLWPGVRISAQIILFYLPGAVFLHTTRTSEVMEGLRRVVPYRLSFLVFVSVRYVPFFFRELSDISAAQRLRGARLDPRGLLDPRNWPDLFHCLLLPLMVRALKTAEEVSRSAEARAFGRYPVRTYYDSKLLPRRGKGEPFGGSDPVPRGFDPGSRSLGCQAVNDGTRTASTGEDFHDHRNGR